MSKVKLITEATDFSQNNYLIEEKNDFSIETADVDEEISSIAGPQLVVPVDNSRYALNAANARWGSLYDALYGTDALGERPKENSYNSKRGETVVKFAKSLDSVEGLQLKYAI